MKEMQTYQQSFAVQQSECDFRNEMMAAAFLRRAQQAAIDHCTLVGLDESLYQKTNTAFLMAKSTIQIQKPISVGQTITVKTMPFAPKRAVYNRLAVFYDENKTEIAVYDSRWVLVDMKTKRILRNPPPEFGFPFENEVSRELDLSISKCTNNLVLTQKAGYSVCDCNRHINNTKYADIATDLLDCSLLLSHRIQKMTFLYHSEIEFGAEFCVKQGSEQPQKQYFLFEKEGKRCAEAEIVLINE